MTQSDVIPHSREAREQFRTPPAVAASLVTGGPVSGLAPILRIARPNAEIALLGQMGDRVVARVHRRGSRLGFAAPLLVGPRMSAEGANVVVSLSLEANGLRITSSPVAGTEAKMEAVSATHQVATAAWVWSLVIPPRLAPAAPHTALATLWLYFAFLMLGLGGAVVYPVGRPHSRPWSRTALVGVSAITLGVILPAFVAGLRVASLFEWVGITLGWATGSYLRGGTRSHTATTGDPVSGDAVGPISRSLE